MSRKVYRPAQMNGTFAALRNAGRLEELLSLYEDDAQLLIDASGASLTGKAAIATELRKLIELPGTMVSNNTFCVEHGDLALLRADRAAGALRLHCGRRRRLGQAVHERRSRLLAALHQHLAAHENGAVDADQRQPAVRV